MRIGKARCCNADHNISACRLLHNVSDYYCNLTLTTNNKSRTVWYTNSTILRWIKLASRSQGSGVRAVLSAGYAQPGQRSYRSVVNRLHAAARAAKSAQSCQQATRCSQGSVISPIYRAFTSAGNTEFFFSKTSRPAPRPTLPPNPRVPEALTPEAGQQARGTDHSHMYRRG